ncbi:SusD/RagB family nutrient-binding outer membrane lipoprotein [Parabacteroides sp.]
MKKIIYHIVTFALLCLTSCTGSFESYNTDGTGFPDALKEQDFNKYGLSLKVIQQGIYFNYDWGGGKNWTFQVMQNLGADMFAGYFHDFNPFVEGRGNTIYNMQDGWNGTFWEYTYGNVMPEVLKSEELTEEKYPSFFGITRILKVECMHRVSDLYGPIIYTNFGSKIGSMPDTQAEVYRAFFKDLDIGIEKIREHMTMYPKIENFAKFDFLMPVGKRTYAEWIRFANSLRLRLAIRIAMADPDMAAFEARKALTDQGGLLQDDDDIIAVSTNGSGYNNPLGEINMAWGEAIMNANMESYLTGYCDPRLPKYFSKAVGGKGVEVIPVAGTYKGIRQGTAFNHKNYSEHSKCTITQSTNAVLMTAAEVWFLRAEAALRKWSVEDVQSCYENGIRASFAQWSAGDVTPYLKSTRTPKEYRDAFNTTFDVQPMSQVTPVWDEAATPEEKLEKIITQKWIACYPEGCEAWAEQRRTGYPRLFPVLVNDSQGIVDTDLGPRRLNFFVGIKTANSEQYNALVDALGGPDNCGTRLWWDTGKNF